MSDSGEQRRRLLLPLYLLIFISVAGTAGYYLLGHYGVYTGELEKSWTWLDCAFMTAISLTTVGYGDWVGVANYPLAMIYTIVLLFVGMGIVLFGVSELTSFFVEGHLGFLLERRKTKRMIETMSDHIILAGVGDVGVNVLQEPVSMQETFVAIEHNGARCTRLRELFPDVAVLSGDAIDEDILAKASIAKARGLIACLPNDRDNLFLTITARSLNPKLRIVARAEARNVETKLLAAGADRIVTPSVTGGLRMASEMMRPSVVHFLDRMMRESGTNRFAESTVAAGSELDGKEITPAQLCAKIGVNVIAVKDAEGVYHYNQELERVLRAGDVIFAIGTPELTQRLHALTGQRAAE